MRAETHTRGKAQSVGGDTVKKPPWKDEPGNHEPFRSQDHQEQGDGRAAQTGPGSIGNAALQSTGRGFHPPRGPGLGGFQDRPGKEERFLRQTEPSGAQTAGTTVRGHLDWLSKSHCLKNIVLTTTRFHKLPKGRVLRGQLEEPGVAGKPSGGGPLTSQPTLAERLGGRPFHSETLHLSQ